MTRFWWLLPPPLAGVAAFVVARLLSPAVPPAPQSASMASDRVTSAPVPAGRPARRRTGRVPCPLAEEAPQDPLVPAGWDAIAAERGLWEKDAPALEGEDASLITVDCSRYPCLAVVAFGPRASASEEGGEAALERRWPTAAHQGAYGTLDGDEHVVRTYQVALYEQDAPPDLRREVELRMLAVHAEASEPTVEWQRAQLAALSEAP